MPDVCACGHLTTHHIPRDGRCTGASCDCRAITALRCDRSPDPALRCRFTAGHDGMHHADGHWWGSWQRAAETGDQGRVVHCGVRDRWSNQTCTRPAGHTDPHQAAGIPIEPATDDGITTAAAAPLHHHDSAAEAIPGTIPGVTGYTIAELRETWQTMTDCPDVYSTVELRLACMAVGLVNQLQPLRDALAAAGEHDTPAGEPATERHDFVGPYTLCGLALAESGPHGRPYCNRRVDHPVHQPAQNPVTPMVVGADEREARKLRALCTCGGPYGAAHLADCAVHLLPTPSQPTSSGQTAEHGIDTAELAAALDARDAELAELRAQVESLRHGCRWLDREVAREFNRANKAEAERDATRKSEAELASAHAPCAQLADARDAEIRDQRMVIAHQRDMRHAQRAEIRELRAKRDEARRSCNEAYNRATDAENDAFIAKQQRDAARDLAAALEAELAAASAQLADLRDWVGLHHDEDCSDEEDDCGPAGPCWFAGARQILDRATSGEADRG